MRLLLILPISLALGILTACTKQDPSHNEVKNTAAQTPSKVQYTCPMHPHIHSDKPGVCPICQMDLVIEGSDNETMATADSITGGVLTLDARRQVLADVRTVLVQKETLHRSLNAAGTLVAAESAQRTITARVSGRVERLFVRQTGERVRAGQALYEIYSPALVQAQSDFLLSAQSLAQAVLQDAQLQGLPSSHSAASPERLKQFSAKARERLLLLGMTGSQINALTESGTILTRVIVYSPYSGTVVQKNIIEGATLQEGASLFELSDFSTVWNIADVFEQDLKAVRLGQSVSVRLAAYTGETFSGRVRFIYPTLNTETRSVKVRIEAANSNGKLRPGMFTETEFVSEIPEALTVPEESVIVSGKRAIVWVKESEENGNGVFRAHTVTLGARVNGKYEVLSGLREGDQVAASGGFLLDAERQLHGGQ